MDPTQSKCTQHNQIKSSLDTKINYLRGKNAWTIYKENGIPKDCRTNCINTKRTTIDFVLIQFKRKAITIQKFIKKFTQKLLSKVSFLIQCTLLSIAMLPPVESFFNSTSRPDPIILVMLRHHGFHCELIMRFSYRKQQPATPDWRTLLKFVCLQLQFQYYQKLITRGKRDQLEIGTESTSGIFFSIFKVHTFW